MDFLFLSAEYCLAFSTLQVLATYQAFRVCFTEPFLVFISYFSLSLVFFICLVVWLLIVCLVYWINPLPSFWTLFAPAWTIVRVPGLRLSSSPLDIVRRSKTTPVYLCTYLSCPQYTCLPFVRPCLCFWPCLIIKAHISGTALQWFESYLSNGSFKFPLGEVRCPSRNI